MKFFPYLLLFSMIIPGAVFANEGYWGTQWKQDSSFMRNIERLKDDPDQDIFIPVLLGVKPGDLLNSFGDARGNGTRKHEGLDIMAAVGTPIVSPTDAVVRNFGFGNSAGNYVYTINPGEEVFVYMHLDKISDDLKPGDKLRKGDFIGTVGYTGNAVDSAPHLHFEIQADEKAENPFLRVNKEFSTEDKIEYLDDIFKSMNNSDDTRLSSLILSDYDSIIANAERKDIDIPDELQGQKEKIKKEQEMFFGNINTDDIDCTIRYRRLVRLWSKGSDVKDIQRCMNSLGFSAGVVDGIYGPNTYRGITQYQRFAGLKYIDGIVGSETSTALNNL